MTKRRTLAMILCLIMCLVMLAACGTSNNEPASQSPVAPPSGESQPPSPAAPSSGGQPSPAPTGNPELVQPPPVDEGVKFAETIEGLFDANLAVINPLSTAGSSGTANNSAYTMIYDRLVEYDEVALTHVPALATRWETDDWQTFRLSLRDDVYFHNGDKFTAQDVVNTVELAKEAVGTTFYNYWVVIDEAKAIDEYTVELILNGVNVHFLYHLDMPMCGIFNKKAIDADPIEGFYVGTGPYKIADFSTNDYVTFERFDDYWGEPAITKTQIWRFVPEVSTRAILLQTGVSQIAMQVAAGDVQFFRNSPDYMTFPAVQNDNHGVIFNMKDPITGDLNFRLAVLHAIDREEIGIVAMEDMFVLPPDGTTGWGYRTEYRNTAVPLVTQDLDKAKEYLAASIYNGEELEITTARVDNVRAMEQLQAQLAKIGISTKINEMDQPSFMAHVNGMEDNGQIMFWAQTMGPNPGTYRNIFYTRVGTNRAKYSNPQVDELLDLARTITNDNERKNTYMQIQELVAADCPIIPLYFRMVEFVAVNGVGGVNITMTTNYDYRYLYMTIE